MQVRTWHLSSIWRVPVEGQTLWLKAVPPFAAPEGALLALLSGSPVPELIGHDGGRSLLAEVRGEDLHAAPPAQLPAMVGLLVELQRRWAGRTDELIRAGLPDWRGAALGHPIAGVVRRTRHELGEEDGRTLERFVAELPARFARLAACGLPETLVHGDCHPGNFRGGAGGLALLDWSDSAVGHPLLDMPAFLGRVRRSAAGRVRGRWLNLWRDAVPGSDPGRAADLIAPVAAARQAALYQGFLDRIEPSERAYHRGDPAAWLRRAAELLRSEDSGA